MLEAKSYKQSIKEGVANSFEASCVLITSYQFACGKAKEVQAVPWDLVVIDEAHRLRNVYKPDSKMSRTLKDALISSPKVLLTATPLQNSLLELYGLVSFVDEKVLGDLDSFRSQFGSVKDAASFDALKRRIAPVCKRTLRRRSRRIATAQARCSAASGPAGNRGQGLDAVILQAEPVLPELERLRRRAEGTGPVDRVYPPRCGPAEW